MEMKLKIHFSPAEVYMGCRNYVESTIMELDMKLEISASTRSSPTHRLVPIVASPSQFLIPVSQETVGGKSVAIGLPQSPSMVWGAQNQTIPEYGTSLNNFT